MEKGKQQKRQQESRQDTTQRFGEMSAADEEADAMLLLTDDDDEDVDAAATAARPRPGPAPERPPAVDGTGGAFKARLSSSFSRCCWANVGENRVGEKKTNATRQ